MDHALGEPPRQSDMSAGSTRRPYNKACYGCKNSPGKRKCEPIVTSDGDGVPVVVSCKRCDFEGIQCVYPVVDRSLEVHTYNSNPAISHPTIDADLPGVQHSVGQTSWLMWQLSRKWTLSGFTAFVPFEQHHFMLERAVQMMDPLFRNVFVSSNFYVGLQQAVDWNLLRSPHYSIFLHRSLLFLSVSSETQSNALELMRTCFISEVGELATLLGSISAPMMIPSMIGMVLFTSMISFRDHAQGHYFWELVHGLLRFSTSEGRVPVLATLFETLHSQEQCWGWAPILSARAFYECCGRYPIGQPLRASITRPEPVRAQGMAGPTPEASYSRSAWEIGAWECSNTSNSQGINIRHFDTYPNDGNVPDVNCMPE